MAIARAAEAAGLEALIPVARWRGMGAPSRREAHRSFESFTWAAGIAAVTERIQVFATFHIPVTHPVSAAKQIATVDHISSGRFAVNLVAGWNEDEFAMFGIEQREHDDRYAVADEWMSFLKQIWNAEGEFDFDGPLLPGAPRAVRAAPAAAAAAGGDECRVQPGRPGLRGPARRRRRSP